MEQPTEHKRILSEFERQQLMNEDSFLLISVGVDYTTNTGKMAFKHSVFTAWNETYLFTYEPEGELA
jgi:hypothetical protein